MTNTDGSSALAMYEQPRLTLIPNEQTSKSASALATLAAASGLCKTQKPADAFFVIMYGYELGIPAMTALRTIHIINNTPVCSGEALLAIIRRSGKVDIKIEGNATEATVWMKRRESGEEYKAHWTINRATIAGLSGKQTWKNFPQAFLQWRGVSECSKFLCSDITNGLYTMEEIAPDLNYDESGTVIEAQTITVSKPEPEPKPDYRKTIDPAQYPPVELVLELHWSANEDAITELVERACNAGYIPECNIGELLELLKVDGFEGYATRKEAGEAIKEAGEARKAAAVTAQITATEAAAKLGQDNKTPIGRTPEPELTGEAKALVEGKASPFQTDSVGDAIKAEQDKKTGSAFKRGLDTYQQTQQQAKVDAVNNELDTLFERNMERNP